ncbi:MAG TPA: hypothetical protein VMU46_13045 [Burkholderiales bacterium]|nr:hypothetical protein [Burkholderiales bacterium]
MDELNLSLVGWLFAVGSGLALALGALIIIGLHRSGEQVRRHLAARVLDDSILFGIWILGIAGGVGVLLEKSWSRWVLELFCWTLMILALLSAFARWRAAPPPRGLLLLSLALFVLPLIAVCIATILTLRGETAMRVLAG